MPNLHRKTLLFTVRDDCKPKDECDDDDHHIPPPQWEHHSLSPIKILLICCIAAVLSFFCYMVIIKTCRALQTRWRRRSRSQAQGDTSQIHQQDYLVHDGSVVFHPIWLINTMGLDQSVIDSIEIFKYRKKDGLTDGTDSDCPVCLGVFQEEESLRLLPRCSHAFHVTCIDTWLRSHTNCPLCRAPVVNNNNNTGTVHQVAELGTHDEIARNEIIGVENDDTNGESSEKKSVTSGVRVQSDLNNNCCQKPELLRRSISMGSFCFVDQGSR